MFGLVPSRHKRLVKDYIRPTLTYLDTWSTRVFNFRLSGNCPAFLERWARKYIQCTSMVKQ